MHKITRIIFLIVGIFLCWMLLTFSNNILLESLGILAMFTCTVGMLLIINKKTNNEKKTINARTEIQ